MYVFLFFCFLIWLIFYTITTYMLYGNITNYIDKLFKLQSSKCINLDEENQFNEEDEEGFF